jgi:hypothetical protein
MDEHVRARLKAADDGDHWKCPPGFPVDEELRRITAVKPKLDRLLGSLELNKQVRDAAHFAELAARVHEGEVIMTKLEIRFSAFGGLFTVWMRQTDPQLVRSVVAVLEEAGYTHVPIAATDEAYDGKNRAKPQIRTWFARFFDYV